MDPVGHKIGPNIAYRSGQGLNWYPVDRFKQTLVGTVEGYDFYNPASSGAEADWNIYIRPSAAFRFIRDDVLPAANPDELHRAADGEPLVEAEITPDENFYNNPFFHENGTSNRVGRPIGVYGPWVMDESHDFRPEIHPCELLWWREARTYHLLVIQDDSNRFDRRSDFNGQIARPWSMFPRHAEFWIAVRVPNNERRRLVIEELYGRHVRSSASQSSPRQSSRTFGTGSRVEVERQFADRSHVGVSFEQFEVASNKRSVFGFVVLKSSVGSGDRGTEGYQVLRVTETT
jgi:hypothetical protein